MNILWVCNTMLPVIAEHYHMEGSNKEGWLTGLCTELLKVKECHLAVAFPQNVISGNNVSRNEDSAIFGEKISAGEGSLTAYGFPEDTEHPESCTQQQETAQKEAFERICNHFQPDVIHCFGTEFPHTYVLAKYCTMPEKLLIGIQGICTEIAKAYMANLPASVRTGNSFRDVLKKDGLLRQQEKFIMRGAREREALSYAGNILGRTDFDRQFSQETNPKAKYFVLNETLRSCFYEGSWDREKCEPHTVFLSQGDYPLKGFHYALLAVGMLKKKYPDVKLFVAGNSLINYKTLKEKIKISGYGRYLRSLIRSLELSKNIEILGKLDAEKMKEAYLRSSVFLCCSANENSPNSLGEAMLLGVPCVAADVGGIPSLFTDGVDGRLYRGFRIREADLGKEAAVMQAQRIADAVMAVWQDPDASLEMTVHAKEHAGKTHDRAKNLQDLLDIYQQISN